MNKINKKTYLESMGLEESTSENIISMCIGLMTSEQLVELYEKFNGGTFDNESFKEWIKEFVRWEDYQAIEKNKIKGYCANCEEPIYKILKGKYSYKCKCGFKGTNKK